MLKGVKKRKKNKYLIVFLYYLQNCFYIFLQNFIYYLYDFICDFI